MNKIIALLFFVGLIVPAYAQEEIMVSDEDQMIIFGGFIIALIAIFVYLAKDMLLRKKTEYDDKKLESQKNKDYEKYHTDWNDDFEDLGARTNKFKEKFRKLSDDESLPDLYAILNISKEATPKEIKEKYRELAKQSHPDKSTQEDAKERMAEINQAYEILSDPEQREEYDKYFSN